ncbi:hypothetical protein I2F17_06155 [Acinetobacter sp. B10A]|uniref:transposase n=1 Tax=Acinetobacter baretiae TaxID=2605383 RepID=UPI001B3C93BC|nr:transposase [Acinetobacter baretiae]MBF7685400.1 hypothetical protein [Acinetobacter baretiae]
MKTAFHQLVSYNRFIEIIPSGSQTMTTFFHQVKDQDIGISIIDSTKITVCHNIRIQRHRVFKGLAEKRKSSTGWFYGLNLHIISKHLGEIVDLTLTSGKYNCHHLENMSDRNVYSCNCDDNTKL